MMIRMTRFLLLFYVGRHREPRYFSRVLECNFILFYFSTLG